MNDVLTPLTEDERTILEIAAKGESMIPIGRWERPVLNLKKRGFLAGPDKFNMFITDAGRAAIDDAEKETDRQLGRTIEQAGKIQIAQADIQRDIESMAKRLVGIIRESAAITGDREANVLVNWCAVLARRTAQLLGGKSDA